MYDILRPKRKEQENATKMHTRRFKISPLHSALYRQQGREEWTDETRIQHREDDKCS